jgi:hypothetical protein
VADLASEEIEGNLDGYTLFNQLDDGDPVTVRVQGKVYTLQFEGDRFGGENCLKVRNRDGAERTYGWGWESNLVFRALEEMEEGWQVPQRYRYHPIGTSDTQTDNHR